MKFLVDAQLPPALCQWLEERGHEVEHVFTIGLGNASDAVLAARAEARGAVLISKDEDFLSLRLPSRFTFLWLRCGNVTTRALKAWLDDRWGSVEAMLEAGEGLIELQ